jgi:HEAT repeat protein
MNDLPRQILKDLLVRYGISVAYDPIRCEGLLRDTCPKCNREIFVLVHAVRLHVPAELLAPRHALPMTLVKGFLAKKLSDELAFSDVAAHWAVDSWAEALGLSDPASAGSQARNGRGEALPGHMSTSPEIVPVNPALLEQWAGDLGTASLAARLEIVAGLSREPGPDAIRLLIGALANDRWEVRSAAFDVLTALGPAAIPDLLKAIHGTDEGVIWRVVLILGAKRSGEAVDELIALLERDPPIRDAAIWALGEIGSRRASTPLMNLVMHGSVPASRQAADALKKIDAGGH